MVEPSSLGLLRAHVMRSAADDPRLLGRVREQREAEVGEFRLVLRRQEDVPRLDVAVDHPLAMGVVEGVGDLGEDRHPARGDSTFLQRLAKLVPSTSSMMK